MTLELNDPVGLLVSFWAASSQSSYVSPFQIKPRSCGKFLDIWPDFSPISTSTNVLSDTFRESSTAMRTPVNVMKCNKFYQIHGSIDNGGQFRK